VNRFDNLYERFEGRAEAIHRLMKTNPSFRELCEDYEEAAKALKFWSSPAHGSGRRADDYRTLVSELEAEIKSIMRKQKP